MGSSGRNMRVGRDGHGGGEDAYGQLAGAIGGLVIVFGVLAATKYKLGLSWTATMLLTAGVLVALGDPAWRIRTALLRARAGDKQRATPATGSGQRERRGAFRGWRGRSHRHAPDHRSTPTDS